MASSLQQNFRSRQYNAATALRLMREGAQPLMARILAARGIATLADVADGLKYLHHHSKLYGAQAAAEFLADGIARNVQFLVVADYDCDGATACAVALRGLRAFGADVNYIVPDRMIHGYGLTPSVIDLALSKFPKTQVIITVDNGVASHAGVTRAKELGLQVLVTDHHLPSKDKPLPVADVIVDPSQPQCSFPSKALAGVGVIWYVLWALQDELRKRNVDWPTAFKVSQLLPLVAVGTVADVVPLDRNNRLLVQNGLKQIRMGSAYAGIYALATVGVANRTDPSKLLTSHIAFGIGPRINAAGRLETMDIGIACLTTDDLAKASELAQLLNDINQQRKDIEYDIVQQAVEQADALAAHDTYSIAVHSPEWHAGVIGIVAGRIKEKRYRPTFVLTTDPNTGQLKGSGRSIPGFNLKDALDQIDKAYPGLMPKFGGHAMAAGVTLAPGSFDTFRTALEVEARKVLTADVLNQVLEHDGELSGYELNTKIAHIISEQPWGQMYPEPVFFNTFEVLDAKLTGEHKDQLNLILKKDGVCLKATKFRHLDPLPKGSVTVAYKLNIVTNKNKQEELKLLLDHIC